MPSSTAIGILPILNSPTFPSIGCFSKDSLDAHAKAISHGKGAALPHVFKKGDTVYIAATDQNGNCVSMLQTVYFDWGSGMIAGDTGILWHNRGASFNLDPASPNCLKPGKRPFHTLNPGMYLKQGRPHLLYGTQGADGQPQTLAAVLTRLIDYNMGSAHGAFRGLASCSGRHSPIHATA